MSPFALSLAWKLLISVVGGGSFYGCNRGRRYCNNLRDNAKQHSGYDGGWANVRGAFYSGMMVLIPVGIAAMWFVCKQ